MDKRDPLRGEPLASYQPTPQSIEIPAYGKPQFNGRLRSESFGHVLLGHSTVMPVAHNADQVVSACNGTTTFIQLVDQFGDNALDLLGEMWHSGLLEIK
jgi:hypothetical protein